MKIAIIDAEIIGKNKHRFPNLCSMKLSSYHKSMGDEVTLLLSYEGLEEYDKVYISKVFTKTPVPDEVLSMANVEYGGTGFFYDKAPPLPFEIEHAMPDYHLYDEWVNEKNRSRGETLRVHLLSRLFNRVFNERLFSSVLLLCEQEL